MSRCLHVNCNMQTTGQVQVHMFMTRVASLDGSGVNVLLTRAVAFTLLVMQIPCRARTTPNCGHDTVHVLISQ